MDRHRGARPDAHVFYDKENLPPAGTPGGKKQQRRKTPRTLLQPTQQLSQLPAPATVLHPTQAALSPPRAPATELHPTQQVNTPHTELQPTQLLPTQPATQGGRASRALSFGGAATPAAARHPLTAGLTNELDYQSQRTPPSAASTCLSSATRISPACSDATPPASTRFSLAWSDATPAAPPPAAEEDALASALSERLRFTSPTEDITSPASSSSSEELGSWLPRARHAPAVPQSPLSPAAESPVAPLSPPTPSPRLAQRPRSLGRRLRNLERSGGVGGAVGAPPLARGRVAKAVADLIRRDEENEDSGPTLVLAATAAAADEWLSALTLALGPHSNVLKHATTARALERTHTPARLGRMSCVVATYAQASRADPPGREARTAPASEWLSSARPSQQAQDSVLHRLTWHRAIYDDAHSLLGTSKRAQATATLDATLCWAVFGPLKLDQLSRKPVQL